MHMQEEILKKLDIEYSYQLARRMEKFRSNEVLGYRPAGSKAEFETGEMLYREMKAIGLSDVCKDAVTVDGWEFKKAVMVVETDQQRFEFQLGAYQTNFKTDGFEKFSLVYLGKGTEKDYEGHDVEGKLVLADINQRDEWWINYPVYQAHLKGAKALIAVQDGGYAEIDSEALNAQDIAGPSDAPAFSISRKDAVILKNLLKDKEELEVFFDADSRVYRDCTTYNIRGCIPGKHPERMVLLSAHYDSYFSGFQDDNTAVAMMFGIARAFLAGGFQPNNTIVFCAMAAEEWGVIDSDFDWSAGAYEQVFTAHPEWVGKVIADLNFELPALAHGTRARIRSCYEYVPYLEEFLMNLPLLTQAYPEETRITAPIETWSDDFSMAIAGIPSMVNDFTGGSFMETHYHSQFDNDDYYDEQVYRLHHELFALLICALDQTAVVPLCFAPVMKRAKESLSSVCTQVGERKVLFQKADRLKDLLQKAEEKAEKEYRFLSRQNEIYRELLEKGKLQEAEQFFLQQKAQEKRQLQKFKKEQDTFVRMDWYGNVLYPHEIFSRNIRLLEQSIRELKEGAVSEALGRLYQVDNHAYACMFDEDVYDHFTDYVFHQPRERLKWGYGRIPEHEKLYRLVRQLLAEERSGAVDFEEEISCLEMVCEKQYQNLEHAIDVITETITRYYL